MPADGTPLAASVSVGVAQPAPSTTAGCRPGTWVGTVSDSAPAPMRAWSIVAAPTTGATSLSNQKLNSWFQFCGLLAVAVQAISPLPTATVQSLSWLPSMSRKPRFSTVLVGQTGSRNDAPPRLLSTFSTAYS